MMRMQNREGFAIPMAIMVIVMLTATVAAAFSRADIERQTNDDQGKQLSVFNAAEAGLQRYLNTRTGGNPGTGDSVRYTDISGATRVDVVMTRIRSAPTSDSAALYLIRSHAWRSGGSLGAGSDHTVAIYGTYSTKALNVFAGWTSLSGLSKNGTSGTLSGVDNCGNASTVAGIAVPTGDYDLDNFTPTGNPPVLQMGTAEQMSQSINIDWAGIVNGTSLTPDITLPGGSFPTSEQFADANYWPVILVNGDFTLPYAGKGTLIVTGNLVISGSRMWEGVIMVGGVAESNGNNTMLGSITTGLNIKLGQTVDDSDVGNGTKTYQYDSCNVESAMSRFTKVKPLWNTWMDNWAAY